MLKYLHQMKLLHSENPTAPAVASPPAAEPAAAPAAPATTEPETNVDFEALSKEFEADSIDLPEEPGDSPAPVPAAPSAPSSPAPTAASTPPSSPSSTPAAPVPAAPAAAAPPTQQPQAQQPAQPAPAQPAADDGVLTPEKVENAYKQFEANLLPQLEKSYELSPEQVQQLEENAPAFIPKLMAKMHYQVQIAAYTGIMSQVPRIIEQVLKHHRTVEEANTKFYNRWPMLKDEKYAQAVDQGLRAYRAANPGVTTADMIEKAGLMLMLSLGLDPTAVQQAQAQAAPITPPSPARPAGVGGAGPVARPGVDPTNVFEAMAEEILQGN